MPPIEKVLAILCEIILLDDETRAEMEVWFAFVAYLNHRKEELAIPKNRATEGIRKVLTYL